MGSHGQVVVLFSEARVYFFCRRGRFARVMLVVSLYVGVPSTSPRGEATERGGKASSCPVVVL